MTALTITAFSFHSCEIEFPCNLPPREFSAFTKRSRMLAGTTDGTEQLIHCAVSDPPDGCRLSLVALCLLFILLDMLARQPVSFAAAALLCLQLSLWRRPVGTAIVPPKLQTASLKPRPLCPKKHWLCFESLIHRRNRKNQANSGEDETRV